ncbi:MAG: c-type cytochrome [Polyangiaceae bacterium]|nr:c-type cytochrome [Polyangiaceae bacterium]
MHEYDGIIELDQRLPRWWVYTLFGAIAFAAGYWVYFHSFDRGELASREYGRIKAKEIAEEAERIKQAGTVTPEMLVMLTKDRGTVEQGQELFSQNCVTCHSEGGKGNIGPNLTDDYWLHGGEPMNVYGTIRDGFLSKQMPAWGKQLGEDRVRAVAAYVLTLKGTNAAGGKAPQGEKH